MISPGDPVRVIVPGMDHYLETGTFVRRVGVWYRVKFQDGKGHDYALSALEVLNKEAPDGD